MGVGKFANPQPRPKNATLHGLVLPDMNDHQRSHMAIVIDRIKSQVDADQISVFSTKMPLPWIMPNVASLFQVGVKRRYFLCRENIFKGKFFEVGWGISQQGIQRVIHCEKGICFPVMNPNRSRVISKKSLKFDLVPTLADLVFQRRSFQSYSLSSEH